MKVLIIHQHFRSPEGGGAIRSYYLATALAQRGAEVVVITAHNESGYRRQRLEGIDVHYLPIKYDNRFTFGKRVRSFLQFAFSAVRAAARHSNADVCYAISTPLTTGLAAMVIRWRYRIPYIFEVGDLWPDAPIDLGFIRDPVVKQFLFALERSIYRSAKSIVALSPPIRDAIAGRVPGTNIHVLTNMSDTSFFRPSEKDPVLEERFNVKGKFVVSYIGALGLANGLLYYLNCAAAAQQRGMNIRFILCGDGAMLDPLKEYSRKLQLENISFIAFQNRAGVRELLNVTDACFISYLPVKILETGSPNKYFDALAAGKLTVINFSGWIKEEIEEDGCGVYVDPAHAEDFVKKMEPFVEDSEMLKQFQCAARKVAEEKYSRDELGDRFASLVRRTCA